MDVLKEMRDEVVAILDTAREALADVGRGAMEGGVESFVAYRVLGQLRDLVERGDVEALRRLQHAVSEVCRGAQSD
jgi:hypothetical protein